MNIYRIVLFDGYNSREVIVEAMDVIHAIQNNGFMAQNVIKIELAGSANKEDYTTAS